MSVTRVAHNEWRIVWELGVDPATGQRRQKTERFHGTKDKALARYVERQKDLNDGIGLETPGLTVAAFADEWLAHKESQGRKRSTVQRYRDMIRYYINPQLGRIALEDLTPLHVQRALRHWQSQPRPDSRTDRETVSDRTIQYAYRTLVTMLSQAVRWQIIGRNVAQIIEPPTVAKPPARWWTADQAAQFLRTVDGHPYAIVFALALLTGLRQGELLGLQWPDVDWDKQTITVRRSQDARYPTQFHAPKTAAARRTVQLDATAMDLLKAHQTAQKRQRLAVGPGWEEWGLVCTSGIGTPLNTRNLRRTFFAYIAKAAVPHIRFHDLRHTHASLFLAHEPNIRILADRLGHTQVSFTIQTYVHASTDAQAKSASAVAQSLFGAPSSPVSSSSHES